MIPLIKREIVDNHHWVSMKEFMEMVAISQTAPGAVAVNTATFVGYKMARYRGALAAILGVSLPSFLVILAVAISLLHFFNTPLFTAFFKGAAGSSCPFGAGIFYLWQGNSCGEAQLYPDRCSSCGSFMAEIAPPTCYPYLQSLRALAGK